MTDHPQPVSSDYSHLLPLPHSKKANPHPTAVSPSLASIPAGYYTRAEMVLTSCAVSLDVLEREASTPHAVDVISILRGPCLDIDMLKKRVKIAEDCVFIPYNPIQKPPVQASVLSFVV